MWLPPVMVATYTQVPHSLNSVRQRNATVIHPWIDEPSNVFAPQDMLRPIPIPDVSPPDLLAGSWQG